VVVFVTALCAFRYSSSCVWAPILPTGLALRLRAPLANSPCLARALRAFGCPSCQLALPCPWSPNLGHAVLKNLPPSQNWYLSVLRLVFFPSAPLCGRFCYGSSCVWGPILPTCLALRLGAPLAESPCLALGLPTLDRPY